METSNDEKKRTKSKLDPFLFRNSSEEPKQKEDVLQELSEAAFKGDLSKIQSLAKQGVILSSCLDERQQTALHIAAFGGHVEVVDWLLKEDEKTIENINARDHHGWTALLCASSVGNIAICCALLHRGADPKITNDQNTTVLHYLCRKYYGEEKDQELTSGSVISSSIGNTGNGESTGTGISSSPSSNLPVSSSSSANPSFTSSSTTRSRILRKKDESYQPMNYFELLEYILLKGVDINFLNYLGETALMQACARGNIEAVNFLLKHRAKAKIANIKGETALFYAEKCGHQEIEKILQQHLEKEQQLQKRLMTHDNVKLDNYFDIITIMSDSEFGIPLKDRVVFFFTHKKCFIGSEFVDWVIRNLPIRTREEAVSYGQKLMDSHWIVSPNKKNKFKDAKNHIYRFSTGEAISEEPKVEKVGIDDFNSLRVLGKGGFGRVLLCEKKDTKKIYAIKLMDKAKILNKPRDFKNLMSEKRILQNDCCFLVHLHWAFQTETDFGLVMDFVGGGDLHYHLKQVRRFPEKAAQFIAAELFLAIWYLHSCGIIYRDLKPQNILLDLDGHICLADFGLSKEVLHNADTALHTACGTPTYSAPEVLDGSPYSKLVDFWSLGIVLYQLLVGKPPYEFDGDFAKLIQSIYYSPVTYPRNILSDNAISLIEALLEKDPHKRLEDPEIVKRHPFFRGIDWEKLEVKKVSSPIKVQSDILKNFDVKYTKLPVVDRNAPFKQAMPDVSDFSVAFD